MQKKILCTLIILILFFCVTAQNKYKVYGEILNADSSSTGYESITIKKNNQVLYSLKSDSLGKFSVGVSAGTYIIKITQLGRKIYENEIVVSQDIDLGRIFVFNEEKLNEILVTNKRKIVDRMIDRTIYNIENMPTAIGSDAAAILFKIPGIKIQNNELTIVGKNKVNLMIDNRTTPLSGNELIEFLRTIPAENISKIELITAPPAQYNAEGNSGIIDIKLKKAKKDFTKISIRSTYTQTTFPKYQAGATFDLASKSLSFTSSLDFGNGSKQITYSNALLYPTQLWLTTAPTRVYNRPFNTRILFEYYIRKNWISGVQYLGSWTNSPINSLREIKINNMSITNRIDSIITTVSNSDSKSRLQAASYYNKFLLNNSNNIYLGFDYFNYYSNRSNNFSTIYYYPLSDKNESHFSSLNSGLQKAFNISGQMDVELKNKLADFKLGWKISTTGDKNNTKFYDKENENYIYDSTQSNTFEYTENIQSLYFSLNKKIKKSEFQIGIRFENTETKGRSITLNQESRNHYLKAFPTVYYSLKIDSLNSINFNYSKRINRPSYSYLNPFRWYSSRNSFTEGNPFLKPSFSNNFELTLNHDENANLSAFYTYASEGFNQIAIIDSNSDRQRIIPLNYINSKSIGLSLSYTFSKIKWWNSTNYITFSHNQAKSTVNITNKDLAGSSFYFSTSNDFNLNLKKSIICYINYWFNTPSVYGLDKFSKYSQLDIGSRIYLLQRKFIVAISVEDLFKKSWLHITSYSNNIKQIYSNYYDSRLFRITFSYVFGAKKIKSNVRQFNNSEEQNRMR